MQRQLPVTESLTEEYLDAFIAECRENLDRIEEDLGALARSKAILSPELVDRVFRAFHTIKGAAAYLEHEPLQHLGHLTERILGRVRDGNIQLSTANISSLLAAADRMKEMVGSYLQAEVQCGPELDKLNAILHVEGKPGPASGQSKSFPRQSTPVRSGSLKVLIVEDDFSCRVLLQGLLSKYGECHVAVNGKEALDAFRLARNAGQLYDLICMDIQMPEMGGREAVEKIRELELTGQAPAARAKIFMTTGVQDMKTIVASFKALCDAYLFKPVRGEELEDHLRSFNLVEPEPVGARRG